MLGMDMRLAFGEMLVVSVHCRWIVSVNEVYAASLMSGDIYATTGVLLWTEDSSNNVTSAPLRRGAQDQGCSQSYQVHQDAWMLIRCIECCNIPGAGAFDRVSR
jgi:hypothetical protein